MLDANMTNDIKNIVNQTLIQNVDGINSAISNNLTLLIFFFTIVFAFIGFFKYDKSKLKDEVFSDVKRDLRLEVNEIKDSITNDFNRYMKQNLDQHKMMVYKEEYLRNLINFELNKMLASELKINGDNNFNEVFGLYSDRLFLIAELTSGDKKQIIKALKKLNIGEFKKLIKLTSIQDYLTFLLENREEIDIHDLIKKLKGN